MHTSLSGVAHNLGETEAECFAMARYFLSLLPARAGEAAPANRGQPAASPRRLDRILDIIPPQANQVYDMRQVLGEVARHIRPWVPVVSLAKGLEPDTQLRMTQVIREVLPEHRAGVLTGPNLAKEIMAGFAASSVVAFEDGDIARQVQRVFQSGLFRVYTNQDVAGCELGGALKNIIALGAGIADGLGYGDNAKAAFVTRGLTEITALGVALGANPLTFSGLAGLGDVITTCASPLSRNHYVGVELAKGRSLTEIIDSMTEVAEGINTTLVAHNLAQQLGLEMPITEKIHQVLYEDYDPRQAAVELMGGNAQHELSGRRWRLFSIFRRSKRPSAAKT